MLQNDYFKKLFEESIRCNAAMEASQDELTKTKRDLSQESVSGSVLEATLLKFPHWVETLRSVVVEELFAKFAEAVDAYVEGNETLITDFKGWAEQHQVDTVQELLSLHNAFDTVSVLEKQGLPGLARLRRSMGTVLVKAQQAQKAAVLDHATSCFRLDDEPKAEGSLEAEKKFVATMARDDLESFEPSNQLSEKMHTAATVLLFRLLSWTAADTNDEEAQHMQELLSAVSKMHRLLPRDTESARVRGNLLKLLATPAELRKVIHKLGKMEDVAKLPSAELIVNITHVKSALLRAEEELEEVCLAAEEEEELSEGCVRSREAVRSFHAFVAKVKEAVMKQLQIDMKTSLAESIKIFGSLESRERTKCGLWAHGLSPQATWRELLSAATTTLLLEDYVAKIAKFVRTTQKD